MLECSKCLSFYCEKQKTRRAVRASPLVDLVAVVMAIVIAVRGGAAVEDVEGNIARRGSEHHQVTLTQGRVVTTVTEGTLLDSVGGEGRESEEVVSREPGSLLTRQIVQRQSTLNVRLLSIVVCNNSSEKRKVDTKWVSFILV